MAKRAGRSMNEQVVRILDAATDPDLSDDLTRVRERLSAAGLLDEGQEPALVAEPTTTPSRPSASRLAQARERAGTGTPLSDLVSSSR